MDGSIDGLVWRAVVVAPPPPVSITTYFSWFLLREMESVQKWVWWGGSHESPSVGPGEGNRPFPGPPAVLSHLARTIPFFQSRVTLSISPVPSGPETDLGRPIETAFPTGRCVHALYCPGSVTVRAGAGRGASLLSAAKANRPSSASLAGVPQRSRLSSSAAADPSSHYHRGALDLHCRPMRALSTSAYDKNVEDQVRPAVVPDDVIGSAGSPDKYWGPHPTTGVFGPAVVDAKAAPGSAKGGANGGASALDQKVWFRPLEDVEKPPVA